VICMAIVGNKIFLCTAVIISQATQNRAASSHLFSAKFALNLIFMNQGFLSVNQKNLLPVWLFLKRCETVIKYLLLKAHFLVLIKDLFKDNI
jgi:carbon starvation protein CstA